MHQPRRVCPVVSCSHQRRARGLRLAPLPRGECHLTVTVCALSAQTHTCIILPCCHSHRCHHLRVRVGALSARCWTGRLARAGPRAARRGQLVQPLATVASTAGERHPCLTRHRSPATADALDLQHLEGAAAVIQCVQHTFQQIAVVCLTHHGAAAGPRARVGTEVDSGSARAGNICASQHRAEAVSGIYRVGLLLLPPACCTLGLGLGQRHWAGTLAGTAGTAGTAATAALWLALLAPQRHFGWYCWQGSGTGWHGQAGTAVRQLAGTGMEMAQAGVVNSRTSNTWTSSPEGLTCWASVADAVRTSARAKSSATLRPAISRFFLRVS